VADERTLPPRYHGEDGAKVYALERYQESDCDRVIAMAMATARQRLFAGEDEGEVREWLTGQIVQAAEDEASRARWGRTAKLTLSENPTVTREACAASLARAVINEWNNRRR